MDRALTNADLLYQIFAYTDTSTNASCARVCKHWFDPATKYLWHTVDDMWKYFLVLAPVIHDEASGNLKFARTLTKGDWTRFYTYTSKVRCLTLKENNSDKPPDSMRYIMQEVARSRTQLILFPNTHKVTVHLSSVFAENSALYLHPKLTSMELFVNNADSAKSLGPLLEIVTDRTGGIEKFSLMCHLETFCPQSQLVEFFRSQSNLVDVRIPYDFASSLMLSTVSSLVRLKLLHLRRCYCQRCSSVIRRPNTSKGFDFGLLQEVSYEAFPNLTQIQISSYLRDILSIFSSPLAPKNLTTFSFEGFNVGSLDSLRHAIEAIANLCESLTFFSLDINVENPSDPPYSLNLSVFSSLYRIHSITFFAVYYSRPLLFSEDEIERLAISWPRMMYLQLNPLPLRQEETSIKISILSVFAKHCQNLRTIGIYLDTICITALSLPTSLKLSKLSRLYFGSSPISDSKEVALYISQLCNWRCSVTTTPYRKFIVEEMDEPALETYQQRLKKWEEVAELLSFLLKAMKRDLSKVDMLEEELDKSRKRIKVFEDQNASLGDRPLTEDLSA